MDSQKKDALLNAKLVGEYAAAPMIFGYSDEAENILEKLVTLPAVTEACLYTTESDKPFATYQKTSEEPYTFPAVQEEKAVYKGRFLYIFHEITYEETRCGTIFMRISTLSLLDRLIRNIFVAILLLIILLIITFIVASHQQKVISKPILKLTALTEKITKNQDYSVKMEYTGIDEISKLYKEISLMLSEITLHQHERDKAEEKLKKLNEELETRVNERTSQLLAINKELESFSYSISHDLRAPLRAIYGFSQILSRRHRDSLNEEGRQYMDYIVESSVRMEHLINDLLNYSRLGRKSVEMRPISLQKILDNIHHDFSQKLKEVGGKLIFEGYDTEIYGDESLLQQIFINLVENAITYRRIEVPLEIKIMCVTNPDSYLIKVSDNGIGIPEEFWEKIFNIFQRLHSDEEYPGTGIGLANVKKSVDKLNGEVWVESVVGQGSTFFIKLPQPKNIFQNV